MMGLNVSVLRDGGSRYDCTMNGISGRHDTLCLVNVEGPFEPTEDRPAALLIKHACFGEGVGRVMAKIVPAVPGPDGEWMPEPRWTMFGGNYAATSDSRFNRAVVDILGVEFFHGAICVHDRIEA